MNDIINYINNSDFEYIIVNKLNEVFTFTDRINKKKQVTEVFLNLNRFRKLIKV